MDNHGNLQFERLLFFSDAVFAIAITLLVIEIKVPHIETGDDAELGRGLVALAPNYVSFLISFFVIGRFWTGHHATFGYLKTWTPGLVRLNLVFLATIAFLPFPTAVLAEYAGSPTAIRFYAIWLIFAGCLNWALIAYIERRPALLAGPITPAQRHAWRSRWLPIVIGLSGLAAASFQPLVGIAVLSFTPLLLTLVLWVTGRKYRHDPAEAPATRSSLNEKREPPAGRG